MNSYADLFNLKDKIAVVTGSAGILGAEFCKALCDLGASIACIDVNADALNQLIEELSTKYPHTKIAGYLCDVSDPINVKKVVAEILQRFSKIDILLNNAATKTNTLDAFFAPFDVYSLAGWREVMAVNLDGMFLMAQAIGSHMVERRYGIIVQTASIYGFLAPDQRIYQGSHYLNREINTPAVYTASKAGVIGLSKHLAALWAPFGVRVNTICPGGVESGQNEEFNKKYAARTAMGRMATKADIVGPMLFLVSDAASYVTGQSLYVDGGLSVW